MGLFLWDSQPSKIFVGDTPISKCFLWDTQVRPSGWGWWQPWANTLAYYPLTSTTTIYEQSWKNKDLTNTWVTFWTYQWVDCAYLPWDEFLYNTSQYWLSWPFTVSLWAYYVWFTSMYAQNPRFYGDSNWNIGIRVVGSSRVIWYNPKGWSTTTRVTENSWANYIVTYDGTNCKLYINSTNVDTTAKSWYTYTDRYLWIGKFYQSWTDYWKWWVSEFIMENKARTAQEVSDYYDRTKANYWL